MICLSLKNIETWIIGKFQSYIQEQRSPRFGSASWGLGKSQEWNVAAFKTSLQPPYQDSDLRNGLIGFGAGSCFNNHSMSTELFTEIHTIRTRIGTGIQGVTKMPRVHFHGVFTSTYYEKKPKQHAWICLSPIVKNTENAIIIMYDMIIIHHHRNISKPNPHFS